MYYVRMKEKRHVNQAAHDLAMKRNDSLSPARRKEIAMIAGKASGIARKLKKSTNLSKEISHGDK